MWRWVVIIARDRPELAPTWTRLARGAVKLDVILDRRQGHAGIAWSKGPERRGRSSPGMELQERGFLVILRPDLASASR
jgi:hypothetical protein